MQQEFNFDFSSAINSGNTKLILFFNPGIDTGSTSDIYYIDDLNWSSTLSTQENGLLFSINVHPNPANNSLFLNSNFNINSYVLSDINGRTLIYENNVNKNILKLIFQV